MKPSHKLILTAAFLWAGLSQAQKIAEIRPYQGRPTMMIDNRAVAPIIYSPTHATGGRWSWEEVVQRNIGLFCKSGVEVYQLDLYLEDIWYEHSDTLHMSTAYKQIQGVLEVCPDANVFIRIHVNAPFWWNSTHKTECTQYADGPIDTSLVYGVPLNNEDGDTKRSLRASMASKLWEKEAGERLQEFCKKLSASKQGNNLVGLHVCGGVFGEWPYWGFPDHSGDTGPAMQAHFNSWIKAKYKTEASLRKAWNRSDITFETISVPGMEMRLNSSFGDYRDPAKEQYVIDYFTCQQQLVADNMEYFCKIAKDS